MRRSASELASGPLELLALVMPDLLSRVRHADAPHGVLVAMPGRQCAFIHVLPDSTAAQSLMLMASFLPSDLAARPSRGLNFFDRCRGGWCEEDQAWSAGSGGSPGGCNRTLGNQCVTTGKFVTGVCLRDDFR
jgi:hypothetical protein